MYLLSAYIYQAGEISQSRSGYILYRANHTTNNNAVKGLDNNRKISIRL